MIMPGEKYHDKASAYMDDGYKIFSAKECMACQPVIEEFMKSDYAVDGYCDEYIHAWWRDVKCHDCKNEFLPCVPDKDCEGDLHWEPGSRHQRTKYGTCTAGDYCNNMTHYCRCEKFEKAV
jgi:hypothetical protein